MSVFLGVACSVCFVMCLWLRCFSFFFFSCVLAYLIVVGVVFVVWFVGLLSLL